LSTSLVRCSHFTLRIQKVIIYVTSEDTILATVVRALQLWLFTYCCLVLPIICIALVLRLGHATGGARVLIWTCWGLRQRLVAILAEFQHSVVYYATDQCRKRLEAYINAGRGHSEHLLWHCLPDIPVGTHHNGFFSKPPTTTHNWLLSEPAAFERRNKPSDEKVSQFTS